MKIVLTGKIRSGKDTVAKMFVEEFGFTEFKLSTGITRIIKEFYPNLPNKSRKHYTHIGQELRKLDENVWLNYTMKMIESYSFFSNKIDPDIIISDMRQQNEHERLVQEGYIVIKVDSTEENRLKRIKDENDMFDESQLYHETELTVDDIREDYLIKNNGTLEDLEREVNRVMMEICWKNVLMNQ